MTDMLRWNPQDPSTALELRRRIRRVRRFEPEPEPGTIGLRMSTVAAMQLEDALRRRSPMLIASALRTLRDAERLYLPRPRPRPRTVSGQGQRWRLWLWDAQGFPGWRHIGEVFDSVSHRNELGMTQGLLREFPPGGAVLGWQGIPSGQFRRWFRDAAGFVREF